MKPLLNIAMVSMLAACTANVGGRLPVERSLSNTSWGYQLVSSPVRAGELSQRFEVRPGACESNSYGSDCLRGNERSEVQSVKDWGADQTRWIGASLYLPAGFRTNSGWTNIIQIKTATNGSLNHNPAPFNIMLNNGRLVANLGWLDAANEQQFEHIDLGAASQLEGRWTDFAIGLGPETGNRVIVFLNGRQMLDVALRYQGATSYYLKYGIYRTQSDFVNVLLWDEIRLGRNHADVEVDESNPVD